MTGDELKEMDRKPKGPLKLIAVLSGNYHQTENWIQDKFDIVQFNKSNGHLIDVNNNCYIIIHSRDQAMGMNFDSYLRSPSYSSLEDEVKARIKL